MKLVDLSHDLGDGLLTYPGIAPPRIGADLTHEASRGRHAPGTEFHLGRIEMAANTGTYLDTPFHRFRDGFDLAGLPLEAVAELPGPVVDAPAGRRGIEVSDLPPPDELAGRAVLLRTGWSRHFGTPAYAQGTRSSRTGFRFFAVPVKVRGLGSFPIRAFARIDV